MRQLHLNTSVGFNEFGVDLPASFTGFPIGVVPPHLLAAVPKVNPNYVFRPETLQIMAAWWQVGIDEPLFINGPHGSGKTSFVEQFCARIGAPLISVTARSRLDRTDLIGHYVIAKDKTMRFADGPLTRAFRDGCVILFNEMSAAPADLWLSINELLEGSPIYIEATNEVVPKHPNCRIVMTDNTRGLSSGDANYQSRHIQDAAVMDDLLDIFQCFRFALLIIPRYFLEISGFSPKKCIIFRSKFLHCI